LTQEFGQTIRKERAYEKYSWILILIPISVLFVFAIEGLAYGYTNMAPSNLVSAVASSSTSPSTIMLLNYLARLNAWSTISLTAFVIFVASTSFRKGKPWAWYAILWVLVSSLVAGQIEIMNGGYYRNSGLTFLLFDVPIVLALLLPIRKFFPRKSIARGI
jgi:hypothetical protein